MLILSLASKEPEYAVFVRAFLFGGQPTFARLERKIQPYNKLDLNETVLGRWKRKALRWRFFAPSAGFDLVRK
jgi:hypothetical protein